MSSSVRVHRSCVHRSCVHRSSIVIAGVIAGGIAMLAAADMPASGQAASPVNVVPLTVKTPHAGFNRMVVTVTLCEPGTARCATIDDVMVDTGSTGLRLEASAVPSWLRLPAFTGAGDRPLAECLRFIHDDAWGPLVRADLHIGGMTATDLPIQIIADDDRPRPGACPTSTVKPTSNGTLGVGPNLFDCRGTCEQNPRSPGVFVKADDFVHEGSADEGGAWSPVQGEVPPASRLPNPVSRFPDHANGVVIELPRSPAGGTDVLVGSLTFGVGTAANNRLGGAGIIRLDGRGRFTTMLGGVAYPDSYIDSGTETNILSDDSLPRCAGMDWAYCPVPDRTVDATIVGADGARMSIAFTVGDYRAARDRSAGAWDGFAEVAEPSSRAFVWGAPLFFGRRVFVVQEGVALEGVVQEGVVQEGVVQEGVAVPGVERVSGPLYAIR
jgi:hypothetical protein